MDTYLFSLLAYKRRIDASFLQGDEREKEGMGSGQQAEEAREKRC